MSVMPKRNGRVDVRCPNCLSNTKTFDEHWVEDGDSMFSCEYQRPEVYVSDAERRHIQNLTRGFDRAISEEDRAYWKDVIDKYIAEEEAKNPPLKWWEYILAFGFVMPVLLVVSAYGALDDALKKRGL